MRDSDVDDVMLGEPRGSRVDVICGSPAVLSGEHNEPYRRSWSLL